MKNPIIIWILQLIVAVALISQPASATILTIDFESATEDADTRKNLQLSGFILSTRCHYHIANSYFGVPSPTGNSLMFDNGGCVDRPEGDQVPPYHGYNTDYIGPSPTWFEGIQYPGLMYVARENGDAFSLRSFIFTTITDVGAYWLTSSKGGSVYVEHSSDLFRTVSFTDPTWSGVDWLLFRSVSGEYAVGFDNLTVEFYTVPEPSSLVLIILALSSLLAIRARHN